MYSSIKLYPHSATTPYIYVHRITDGYTSITVISKNKKITNRNVLCTSTTNYSMFFKFIQARCFMGLFVLEGILTSHSLVSLIL